jgi:hypothetical protein
MRDKRNWLALAAVIGGVGFCAMVLSLVLNRGDDGGTGGVATTRAASTTSSSAWSSGASPSTAHANAVAGAPAPKITLTVNGSREAGVTRGWPAVVSVALFHPAELSRSSATDAIAVKGRSGDWPSSVRVSVRDARGAGVEWPLQPAGSAPADVTIARSSPATADWVLSPEQTAALPEGQYELVAELDAPDGVRAGPSVPVNVTVRQPPPTLDARQQAELHLTTAEYHFARGDATAAGAALDQLLAQQPTHVTALARKAELLATQDRFDEALEFCAKAIDAHLARATGDEPPHGLLALQRDLLDAAHRD